MRKSNCDLNALKAYLRGDLDEQASSRIEAHALECESCRAIIEGDLAGVAAVLKAAAPEVEVPTAVHLRVQALVQKRPWWQAGLVFSGVGRRRLWWQLAPVLVAAALLAFWLLRPSPQDLLLEHTEGVVLANGVEWKGNTPVPPGSKIVCLGRTEFTLHDVHIESDTVRTVFQAERFGREWRFTAVVGRLRFVDGARPTPYTVVAGTHVMRPLGTRFEVQAGAQGKEHLAVYQDRVEVRSGSMRSIIAQGMSTDFLDIKPGRIADDPTALMIDGIVLVPQPDGKVLGHASRTNHIALPSEVVSTLVAAEKIAWQRPKDAAPYLQIALALDGVGERAAAADAMQQALDHDGDLRAATDSQLWSIFRSQAVASDGRRIAVQILDLLDRRNSFGSDYRKAWRDWLEAMLAPSPDWIRAVNAARKIGNFSVSADRLSVGSALLEVGVGRDGRDKKALGDAQRFLGDFTAGPEEGTTRQQLAGAWVRLGEALYMTDDKKDRQRSIQAVQQGVELWPVPRWQVLLATRLCIVQDIGEAGQVQVYQLLNKGLIADPSYNNYSLARSALVALAASEQDWQNVTELTLWMADTFWSMPDANFMAAGHLLGEDDPSHAEVYLQRAMDLVGRENLDQRQRNDLGILLWRKGRQEEAYSTVGYSNGKAADLEAWNFFAAVGQYETALRILRDPALNLHVGDDVRKNRAHFEADLLVKLGRRQEAIAAYRAHLQQAETDPDMARQSASLLVESRLALGDLLLEYNPAMARSLGQQVLQGMKEIALGGKSRQRDPQFITARAHWLMGKRPEAIQEMERYLSLWPTYPDRKKASSFLERWRTEVAH